jgi:hypothetical protein
MLLTAGVRRSIGWTCLGLSLNDMNPPRHGIDLMGATDGCAAIANEFEKWLIIQIYSFDLVGPVMTHTIVGADIAKRNAGSLGGSRNR